jgi:hypothetical protein
MKENLKNRREAAKEMRADKDSTPSEESKDTKAEHCVESMSTAS